MAALLQPPEQPTKANDVGLHVQDVGDICQLLAPGGVAVAAEKGEIGRTDAAVDRLAEVLVVARDQGLVPLPSSASHDRQQQADAVHALLSALPQRPLLRLLLPA